MNKFIFIIIIVLITAYFLYSKVMTNDVVNVNSDNSQTLDVDFIRPPEIITNDNSNNFKSNSLIQEKKGDIPKFERNRELNELFTEEGQNFKTIGELMFGSGSDLTVNMNNSPDLAAQLERTKYNLKIAKELAELSKNITIPDGKGGTKLDDEVMAKIAELHKNIILDANLFKHLEKPHDS